MADKLLIFNNPEKKAKIRLGNEDYMPMSGSRCLVSGMPNSGKRNLIMNIIHRMCPKPSHCHIVHCDPYTNEYDSLADMEIPVYMYSPEDFPNLQNIMDPDNEQENEKDKKEENDENDENINEGPVPEKPLEFPLVIVDEVTTDNLGKEGSSRFERLINHICTHKNTTCICSTQSIINLPAKVRRGFNHYALWKQADSNLNTMVANRAGIKQEILEDLFKLCNNQHDFIWIDLDVPMDSMWKYRLNFVNPITIQNE